MRLALKLHPDSSCSAVDRIEVDVVRTRPAGLLLRYCVTGTIGALRLPGVTTPARADGLWRHTCFEAFVRALPQAAYHEFNFAPSTQWAAYRFGGYRTGMTVASEIGEPVIDVRTDAASCRLQAALTLDGVAGLPSAAIWRLGLAAVIEDTSGALSYWALAHPAGQADFHHSDCFAHEISAA
ncbi:MAG: DOMON-like domain-containing protein [Rhizobiales bacterium]|nr:DOMON-like domain-containing protein [Hyphomicrobiales bacterium]